MRLLIDTHLLIWAATQPDRLSQTAIGLIGDTANDVMFSTVSVAEVSIKWALRRPDFKVEPRDFRHLLIDNGYEELPFTGDHACRIGDLPPIHKDPFDRMLLAQAQGESVPLVTADTILSRYPVSVRLV